MPAVSIIIVNWNSKVLVRDALGSLFAHCETEALEVVVVDSGSFDRCEEMLAAEFPSVRFIQSVENIGFARANNLGAAASSGKYLLFLNPDTLFLNDTVAALRAYLEQHTEVGAAGPRLLNKDHSLQTSCVQAFPTVLNQAIDCEFLRRRFPRWSIWGTDAFYAEAPSEVEAVSGACIMMPRTVFNAVGGFTTDYFMYGEDIDLCFKVRRHGTRVAHVPGTPLVHLGGGSSSQAASTFSTVAMRQSMHTFMRRNRSHASATGYRIAIGASAALRLVAAGPLVLLKSGVVRHGRTSLRKSWAIVRWAVGAIQAPQPATRRTPLVLAGQPTN